MAVSQMQSYLDSISTKWKRRWYKIGVVVVSFGAILTLRKVLDVVQRKSHRYPPGPAGLPFFGSLFQAANLPKYASYLASSYGPVTMLYLGSQRWVFLHCLKDIEQIFHHKDALDRTAYKLAFAHLQPHEVNTGFGALQWHDRKRKMFQSIILSGIDSALLNKVHSLTLKQNTFHSMETCIQENKLWFPSDDINFLQFNTMWYSAFGVTVSSDNPRRHKIQSLLKCLGVDLAKDLLFQNLKMLSFLPRQLVTRLVEFTAWKDLQNVVEQQIYEILKYDERVFDLNDTTWNDHFEKVRSNHDSPVASKFIAAHRQNPDITSSKNAILQEVMLMFAGIDVTSTCLEYGVILLAKYPKEQQQMYEELKGIFGDDVMMEHKEFRLEIQRLHYLRAFVNEIFRLSCVSPIGVPRYNPKSDIWLKNGKYRIPKGSVIVGDAVQSHLKDPYWVKRTNGKTSELCLGAWLNDRNRFKYNTHVDKVVTFGIGGRECAAKAFVVRALYLMFSKFILSYRFSLPKGSEGIEIKQTFEFAFRIDPPIGVQVHKR